jgi:hypothetical protein
MVIDEESEVCRGLLAFCGEQLAASDIDRRLKDVCLAVTELAKAEGWRRYSELHAAAVATSEGMECIVGVAPAAQGFLEGRLSPRESRRVATQVSAERRHWVNGLAQLPAEVLTERHLRLATATAAFRPESPIGPSSAAIAQTQRHRELARLIQCFKSPVLRVGGHPLQLDLEGLGYRWTSELVIAGQPVRTTFGVRVVLLDPLPSQAGSVGSVHVHHDCLALPLQEALDTAERTRAKVWIRGHLGLWTAAPRAPTLYFPTHVYPSCPTA